MKKNDILKDVFSASMNLQMAHVDEESYERYLKIISHNSTTSSILFGVAAIFAAVWFFLDPEEKISLYELIPAIFLIIMYVRYRHLHKQALQAIRKLSPQSASQSK